MSEGEREVLGVGEIANEANTALSTMLAGIGRIAELIADVTTFSREQSTTMHQLAEMIDGVEGVSNEAAVQARNASEAATRQMRALEGLAETSRSLALLAERLRRSTGRFTVPVDQLSSPTAENLPNETSVERREPAPAASPLRTGGRSLSAA
jgi:methyl-accepting chemotaxis protein